MKLSRFPSSAAKLEPLYVALAVVVPLALTIVLWHYQQRDAERDARAQFDFRIRQAVDAIDARMLAYAQVLQGAAGLLAAHPRVSRDTWRVYIEASSIETRYPGIQGLGYAPLVSRAAIEPLTRSLREEGLPLWRMWPEGERDAYAPVAYIEPASDRNLRALGFDMYSEPVRRAAMDAALDRGDAVLTGRTTLVQDAEEAPQAGVLLYLPVYRRGTDPSTPAARRAALSGFVHAAFRMDDLLKGTLGERLGIEMQIFDGPPDASTLLADSHGWIPGRRAHKPVFTVDAEIPLYGRTWTARFDSTPEFEALIDRDKPRLMLFAGLLLTAMLAGLVWTLLTTRARALALARDMTGELAASEERLALALDASNLALFDWDLRTGQVLLSEQWAHIIGAPPGVTRTTARDLQRLVHPDDRGPLRERLSGVLKGESPHYRVEHRVRTAAGDWKWILSRAKVTQRDAAGRAVRVTGTNADVSERKAVERLKDEFIATVSHELRTPLTAIVGSLALLREGVLGRLPEQAASFLELALRNGARLQALVNDILDIEKIESGAVGLEARPVAIEALLVASIELNRPFADRLQVKLELAQPVPDVEVMADPDRLQQVLANLLSNAAKFAPAGSAVTVAASLRDDRVHVAVTDRGPGVPPEFRDRVFQKFAQADASDTRRNGGTGLGLSICKALIEEMGGTIGYESEPGRGATFHFELPRYAGEPARATVADSIDPAA